jgi:hypothetical protein
MRSRSPALIALIGLGPLVVLSVAGCSGSVTSAADDLSVPPPDLAMPVLPDLTMGPDLRRLRDLTMMTGGAPGDSCTDDSDCTSLLCQPVVLGGDKICVTKCSRQTDCAKISGFFCEPFGAGTPTGLCIPTSASHCASCKQDSDCGMLADRCFIAPGDNAPACHVDCSLAPKDACPSDYTCTMVNDNGAMRSLCIPNSSVCADAMGGSCDYLLDPQPCTRTSSAGSCTGGRDCDSNTGRFTACGASTPMARASCSDPLPDGCTVTTAPSALTGPGNCGACGNKCPGYGQPGVAVACTNPTTKACSFACSGDNYDVDNDISDGCEEADDVPPGHTMGTAGMLTSQDCSDSSMGSFTGSIDSDSRTHNPPVMGFNATTGSAPDYWAVQATGGTFCTNNYSVTISTSGGGSTTCYRFRIITDKLTDTANLSGNDSATLADSASGRYSSGSTIYFVMEKTCSLPTQEAVFYSVSFNL